jgi:hypothetical protein
MDHEVQEVDAVAELYGESHEEARQVVSFLAARYPVSVSDLCAAADWLHFDGAPDGAMERAFRATAAAASDGVSLSGGSRFDLAAATEWCCQARRVMGETGWTVFCMEELRKVMARRVEDALR